MFKSLSLVTRRYSSNISLVNISIDSELIALVSLRREPVNAMNLDLLQDLNKSLDYVKENKCKGLVITSETSVFSAGIDLNEMYKPDVDRLRMVWSGMQELFLKIYANGEFISTAAINGYTAAGACALTLLCDYRVMVNEPKAKMGLNDSMVGIVPRPWLTELMNRTMGFRNAEIALTASKMYSAAEAHNVNLVDEIAIDKQDAIEKCKQFIRSYDDIPTKIRVEIKKQLRENVIKLVSDNREEDTRLFVESVKNPYVQKRIATFMEQIKSKPVLPN